MKLNQEQLPELVKYLGLEEVESLEQAKEAIQSKYVTTEEHTAKIGKITGSIANVARKAFEPLGIVASDDDFKDKKLEEALRSLSEKAGTAYKEKIEELEKRASGQGSEELIKDWEKKYLGLEKKLKETDQLRNDAISQFETFKSQVENEKKQNKISTSFEQALNNAKVSPEVDRFKLKGFKAEFQEKYLLDIEDDSIVIKDRKSNEKLKSDTKAGKFMTLEDVVLKEAAEAGILQKAQAAGKIKGRHPIIQMNERTPSKADKLNPKFVGI